MEAKAQPGIELDAQYRSLREEAGRLPREERVAISVTGAEAADYLQGQLTNDVEAIGPGEGCYAALLDRKGHMQADMRILRRGEGDFLLETEAIAAPAVLKHLTMYKIGRDVEVADASAGISSVSVIGPAAAALVLDGTPAGPEHSHRETRIGAVAARVASTGAGVDILAEPGDLPALEAELDRRGVVPVSAEAAEIIRVERGVPRFGAEMSERTMPAEAGIVERAVSFTKGCYIGQETVARLHYRGKPNRNLRGLRLDGPARRGDPVRIEDREVGEIGTAVLSPAHGHIALAILRREAEPGMRVSVGDGNSAEVTEPPF